MWWYCCSLCICRSITYGRSIPLFGQFPEAFTLRLLSEITCWVCCPLHNTDTLPETSGVKAAGPGLTQTLSWVSVATFRKQMHYCCLWSGSLHWVNGLFVLSLNWILPSQQNVMQGSHLPMLFLCACKSCYIYLHYILHFSLLFSWDVIKRPVFLKINTKSSSIDFKWEGLGLNVSLYCLSQTTVGI